MIQTKFSNIPAYILCGGKSARMKTDKGMVLLSGKPFVQWVIEAVEPLVEKVFLLTDKSEYSQFSCPLVRDIYKEKGPVGGLFTALSHTVSDRVIVISCDTPCLTTEVIRKYLCPYLSDESAEIFVLSDGKSVHPLIGIYSKSIVSHLICAIKNEKLKLMNVLEKLNFKSIIVAENDRKCLSNFNTIEQVQAFKNCQQWSKLKLSISVN